MVEGRKDKNAMKRRYIPLLMVTGVVLGSCVGVQRVNLPDMPYRKPIQRTTLPPNTAPVTPVLPTAPTGTGSGAAIPAPKVTPPPAPKPATPTTTAPKPATPAQPKLPKPEQPKLPTPTVPTTPAVTPPAPSTPSTPSITHPTVTPPAPTVSPNPPATPAPTPAPVKKITNEGGKIPVAVQVEGDPTRVYNPLDPSRKLRIIDKNGNRVSSGKKMKVPGTDFIFIVP